MMEKYPLERLLLFFQYPSALKYAEKMVFQQISPNICKNKKSLKKRVLSSIKWVWLGAESNHRHKVFQASVSPSRDSFFPPLFHLKGAEIIKYQISQKRVSRQTAKF